MKPKLLYRITQIHRNSIQWERSYRFIGELCLLTDPICARRVDITAPHLRVKMLTGPNNGITCILDQARVEIADLNSAIAAEEICTCRGLPEWHIPHSAGCYLEESPPFCGDCGQPCTAENHTAYDKDEFAGAPCKRPYSVTVSDCCQSEDLFADPSLTQPL